jgi:hypothetical protein
MKDAAVLTRELINEMITPEEERAWMTWWAEHPQDKAQLDIFVREQSALMDEAAQLLERGEDPGSPATQELVRRHNELLLRCNVRERNRCLRAWNATATEKWVGVGVRLSRIRRGDKLTAYWTAAMRHSPWGKALRELLLEVRTRMQTQSDPSSPAFDAPVRRLQEICIENGLGDALLLIEWRRFMWPFYGHYSPAEETYHSEWDFMEKALQTRAPRSAL